MPELVLCESNCKRDLVESQLGIPPDQLCDPFSPRETSVSSVQAYHPYILLDPAMPLLRRTHGYYQAAAPIYYSPPSVRENLFKLVERYGHDATQGLAVMMNDKVSGGLNSSAEVMHQRLGLFNKAVKDYQATLLKLRDAYQQSDPAVLRAARDTARRAFDNLQQRFLTELSTQSLNMRTMQRNPLIHFGRADNIARSSRSTVKLHVSDHDQAYKLVRFATYAKLLGNGITMIDFGSRVGEIRNEYKSGGDWNRTMFVEGASFATSAYFGMATANAGVAALTFLMAATPIGWVGLIVGGAVIAAASAGIAYTANGYLKDDGKAGAIYDYTMTRIQKIP